MLQSLRNAMNGPAELDGVPQLGSGLPEPRDPRPTSGLGRPFRSVGKSIVAPEFDVDAEINEQGSSLLATASVESLPREPDLGADLLRCHSIRKLKRSYDVSRQSYNKGIMYNGGEVLLYPDDPAEGGRPPPLDSLAAPGARQLASSYDSAAPPLVPSRRRGSRRRHRAGGRPDLATSLRPAPRTKQELDAAFEVVCAVLQDEQDASSHPGSSTPMAAAKPAPDGAVGATPSASSKQGVWAKQGLGHPVCVRMCRPARKTDHEPVHRPPLHVLCLQQTFRFGV